MKKLVFLLFFFVFSKFLFSQTLCGPNAGFGYGNFTGWQGDTGDVVINSYDPVTNLYSMSYPLYMPGMFQTNYIQSNHLITYNGLNGGTTDPLTCNTVPYVCPWGGQYSMRLGNIVENCHTQDAYYRMTVDPANPILMYAYAPVLQDPQHQFEIQPYFLTYIKDGSGNIIPCSYYKATATNLRGTLQCYGPGGSYIVYKNWQNIAIDLSAYAGQQITLYFQTADCGFCGHFGYAYVDVIGCYPKRISIAGCASATSVTLNAPTGFQSYLWSTGERTQSITVNPFFTPSVTCTITSVQGCQIVLTANTLTPSPNVNFSGNDVCLCDNALTNFTNFTTTPTSGPTITSWDWNFGDNTPHSNLQNPSHHYSSVGTYTVSLVATASDGCNYGITKQVRVYPCATISMIRHN